MIEPKPVKLVERGLLAKRIVALVSDFLLTDQFFLRSRQLFRSQTIGSQFPDLIEQTPFSPARFLGVGTDRTRINPGTSPCIWLAPT